jgi:excisionase family DNA binding protein
MPEPPELPEDLMTTKEAARLLKTCPQTILRWILKGKLPGYRIGYRWRVSRAELLAMVRHQTPAEAQARQAEAKKLLPPTKKELADDAAWVDAELKRMGIRK